MKSCCWTHLARGQGHSLAIKREEQLFIQNAFQFLDRPGFLIRLANSLGKPLNLAMSTLPEKHQRIIHSASEAALKKGLVVVTRTVNVDRPRKSFSRSEKKSRGLGHWHSLASFGLGAAGGFFGIVSLPVELPATTAIMLRSIASIAHEFGMDLNDPGVQLECLYILSLGSGHRGEDAMGSAYWSSRAAFSRVSGEAANFLTKKTAKEVIRAVETRTAPMLMRFLSTVAARFEIVVSEKFIAEAIPVLGALGGGMINAAFTEYFSEAARFHFGLRALEKRHGREAVEDCYLHFAT